MLPPTNTIPSQAYLGHDVGYHQDELSPKGPSTEMTFVSTQGHVLHFSREDVGWQTSTPAINTRISPSTMCIFELVSRSLSDDEFVISKYIPATVVHTIGK